MNGINFETIALMVLGTVIASTKDQVNEAVDKAAAGIVAAVKSSDTALDETVVRDALAPALTRLAAKISEGLAA